MMRQQLPPERIASVPPSLDSAQAKLVYFYLTVADGATVDDLNRTLSMKKIDALSVLRTLEGEGLVDKRGTAYVAR